MSARLDALRRALMDVEDWDLSVDSLDRGTPDEFWRVGLMVVDRGDLDLLMADLEELGDAARELCREGGGSPRTGGGGGRAPGVVTAQEWIALREHMEMRRDAVLVELVTPRATLVSLRLGSSSTPVISDSEAERIRELMRQVQSHRASPEQSPGGRSILDLELLHGCRHRLRGIMRAHPSLQAALLVDDLHQILADLDRIAEADG